MLGGIRTRHRKAPFHGARRSRVRVAPSIRLGWHLQSDWGGTFNQTMQLGTCKQHDVNPQDWLSDVLARIPTHRAKRVHELLPHRWQAPA